MTDISKAWVWSRYRGVVSEDHATAASLPLFGGTGSVSANRTKRGLFVAAAIMIGLIFPKIAFLLLIFSGLMILSGLEPKRFEDFFKAVPGGDLVLKILAVSDTMLP
jgi:hypothetical protein